MIRDREQYDYEEVAVSVAYLDLAAATVSYQPNYTSYSELGFASRRPAAAYELTGRWPLKYGFAVTGGAGYYDLQRLFGVGYWAGDLGAAYVYRRLTLDLQPLLRRLGGGRAVRGRQRQSYLGVFRGLAVLNEPNGGIRLRTGASPCRRL